MKHIPSIAGRELASIFSTPAAYMVFAVYMVFAGFVFFASLALFLAQIQQIQAVGALQYLEQFNLNDRVIGPAFGTCSVVFIILIPLLTMRVFAEERATGSIELLLTSPISIWEIVLGKYLAVLGVVGFLIGLTALFPALLFFYGDPELLQTLAGLIVLFLYGAGLAAIGCFISALTRSQIIAAFSGIVLALLLLLLDVAAETSASEVAKDLLTYLGTRAHFEPGIGGQIRSEDLAYFGVTILVFLSLARAAVDSLRWR